MNILLIKELVNKDGSRISGDEKIDQDNNMTTSKITTDDKVRMQRQGISWYTNFGRVYYNEDDDTNDSVGLPPEDKELKEPKRKKGSRPKRKQKIQKPNIGTPTPKHPKLKESGKNKMNSLIEDIFTKKDFDKEFVEKRKKDLRLNGIESLESIRDTNPILIRKVGTLKDLIEKNSASGEEKAVILNFLLDIDMTDVPQQYKEELKKKIR
tara:strand:+ start:1484 stop:2113 length:630 start_codon:yes stop_codon:yes gene_type:complete